MIASKVKLVSPVSIAVLALVAGAAACACQAQARPDPQAGTPPIMLATANQQGGENPRVTRREAGKASSTTTPPSPRAQPNGRGDGARVVDASGPVGSISWSPDGKLLATQVLTLAVRGDQIRPTGSALHVRDAATGAILRTLYDDLNDEGNVVYEARFSPDGKSVAAVIGGMNVVKLWDPATGEETRTFEGAKCSLATFVFSRDGRFLAAAGIANNATGKTQGMVVLWDTGSGKRLWRVEAHEHEVYALAFSPDGKLLATGGRNDATIKLWDTATGKCGQTLRAHEGERGVFSLAFSPDGKLLASGGLDGTVRLWDADSGKLKQWVASGYIMGLKVLVAFSPDGRRLAVGGTALGSEELGRGDVRLFDASSGRLERAFTDLLRGGVGALAFSPDGKTLAVGNWNKQLVLLPLQK